MGRDTGRTDGAITRREAVRLRAKVARAICAITPFETWVAERERSAPDVARYHWIVETYYELFDRLDGIANDAPAPCPS